jgi:hypothetical protein
MRAHGDVQRRDGLIQHDQRRSAGYGPRDGQALALAAGEFARQLLEQVLGEAYLRHQPPHLRRSPAARHHAVQAQRIGEDAGDGGARIERRQRVLEYHLDATAHRA